MTEPIVLDDDDVEDMPPSKQRTKTGMSAGEVVINLVRRDWLAKNYAPALLSHNGGPALPDGENKEPLKLVWAGVTDKIAGDIATALLGEEVGGRISGIDRVRVWLRDPSRSRMPGGMPSSYASMTDDEFDARRKLLREGLSEEELAAAIGSRRGMAQKRQARADALAAFRRKNRRLTRR